MIYSYISWMEATLMALAEARVKKRERPEDISDGNNDARVWK